LTSLDITVCPLADLCRLTLRRRQLDAGAPSLGQTDGNRAISERLQQISTGVVQVQQGSLYPALRANRSTPLESAYCALHAVPSS
jgi:hypothetical protein